MSMAIVLFVGSALLACALAAVVTPLIARLAERLGMLDIPGGRRTHPRPIPRPGGLAIALAFGIAIATFWAVDRIMGGPFLIPDEVRSPRFTQTALAALLGMTLGFIDDAFELRARWQFLGLMLVSAIIVRAGIRIDFVDDPFGSGIIEFVTPIAIAFTFFWIIGMNVALNFIDGLDGLAAGVSAIAAALLVLGVPIIDTFYVILRRVLQGQPPFAPDRGHLHHRLLDVGLSHAQAVLLIYALTLGFGALAFLTTGRTQVLAFVGAVVLFGVAVVVLAQRSSRATELDPNLYADEADRF